MSKIVRDYSRTDRIADQMQRDLATLIRVSLKDPRIGLVTINEVNVARDLGYADIYVTLLTIDDLDADSEQVKETINLLNGAAGFLRKELGRMIKLRIIPQLRFHFDATERAGRKLDQLIRDARSKDALLHVNDVNDEHDEQDAQDTESDTDDAHKD